MGFPKGASIPFAIISIGGGVKSPPAKWLRLMPSWTKPASLPGCPMIYLDPEMNEQMKQRKQFERI